MQPKVLTADGSLYYLTQEFLVEAYSAEFDPVAMKVLGHEPLTDRAVGNNRDPEPSPNGESVAFIRRRTGMPFAIVVCSLTCREERVVGTINGSGAYGARTLQWFPDSRSLLVIDAVEFRKRFRQIDVNSGEVKVLMEAPWSVWTGAVSSDGQALFYSYKEEGAVRLIKRRLDNGVETELFRAKSDGIGLFGLTASPDGTSLAYALNVENGRRALYVISTDGGTPREIHRSAPEGIWVTDIRWMTDSRALVVVGSGSVLAISAKGGDLKPLGLTMKEISGPTITPDGRRLVFGARMQREELWVVRNLLPDRAGR
jgi:dipeptidyl aminopeptidase/acylaminoacyl peptidase